jgi:hypothetical protein
MGRYPNRPLEIRENIHAINPIIFGEMRWRLAGQAIQTSPSNSPVMKVLAQSIPNVRSFEVMVRRKTWQYLHKSAHNHINCSREFELELRTFKRLNNIQRSALSDEQVFPRDMGCLVGLCEHWTRRWECFCPVSRQTRDKSTRSFTNAANTPLFCAASVSLKKGLAMCY